MVAIMCTLKMQKALVAAGQPWTRGGAPEATGPGQLGNWAATITDAPADLVVALNEGADLTVVIPFEPPGTLRSRFAARVTQSLINLGVARKVAAIEGGEVAQAAFVRLRNPVMTEELELPAVEADLHADGPEEDQLIEDMLMGLPRIDPSCPHVPTLFGVQEPRRRVVTTGPRPARAAGDDDVQSGRAASSTVRSAGNVRGPRRAARQRRRRDR